ncbi:MAG: hypothetical protein ACRDE5_16635, partial [Ginsengibacter sp.]
AVGMDKLIRGKHLTNDRHFSVELEGNPQFQQAATTIQNGFMKVFSDLLESTNHMNAKEREKFYKKWEVDKAK